MKMFYAALVLALYCISLQSYAQLEVQLGAGGLFSNVLEVYQRSGNDKVREFEGASAGFSLNGLVGVSLTEKWNMRGRVVMSTSSEKTINQLIEGEGRPSVQPVSFDARYLSLGMELQWRPTSLIGLSIGPYYAFDIVQEAKLLGTDRELGVRIFEDYIDIKPAMEVYFGRFIARLDVSLAVTPATEIQYIDLNGQPIIATQRYWNGASIGLSYRLIKA